MQALRTVRVDRPGGAAVVELVRRRGLLRPRYEVWLRSPDGRARLWAGASRTRAEAVLEAEAGRLARPKATALPERSYVWLARLLDRPLALGARDLALEDALSNLGFGAKVLRSAVAQTAGVPDALFAAPRTAPLDRPDPERLVRLLPALSAVGGDLGAWAEALVERPDLAAHLPPAACVRLAAADADLAETFAATCAARLPAVVGPAGLATLAEHARRPFVRALAARWHGAIRPSPAA